MALLYQTRKSDWQSPLGGLFQGMAAGDEQRQKMMQHLSEQNAAQASSLLEQQKLKSNKFNELYDDLFKIKSPGGAQIMQKRFDEAGIEMDVKAWWKDTDSAHAFAQRDTTRAQGAQKILDEAEKLRLEIDAKKTTAATAAENKMLAAEKRDFDAKETERKTIDSRQKFFLQLLKSAYNMAGTQIVLGADFQIGGDSGNPQFNEAMDIGLTRISQGWSVERVIDWLRVKRRDLFPTNASGAGGYYEVPWSKSGGNIGGEGLQENPKGSSPPAPTPKPPTEMVNGKEYQMTPEGLREVLPDSTDGFGARSKSYEDTIGEVEGLPFKSLPIPDPMEGRLKLGLGTFRRAGGA